MGEVYLALDTRLDRQVAIKALAPQLSTNEDFRDRFLREAKTAAKVSHPNICSIYAIEERAGATYIIMEYVDGLTLKQMVAPNTPSFELIYQIAEQCCDGMAAAHGSHVMHRDIKSSNIMVTGGNRVKIMDFGLAKLIGGESQTRTSGTMGTFHYVSPEQILGRDLDYRTDLFSLGVVLYELLTGQLPFPGENVGAITYAIVHSAPKLITTYRPDAPEELRSIVTHALEKDPSRRYQSAANMLSDLRARVTVKANALESTHKAKPQRSIAVYPFRNLSPDPENEYIADGLGEDVISRLSKIRSLKVASRTSVFRFKGEQFDPIDVARTLQVSTFLEGSIRKYGTTLRVNVQLNQADDGFTVWSEQFDRASQDILGLQTELAGKIAQALEVQLNIDEEKTIVRRAAVHHEAYDYYLRGKFHLKRRDRESVEKGIQLLTRATEIDPQFAPPYAQLSIALGLRLLYGSELSPDMAHKAYALAQKAVELDPLSSDAHMALAMRQRNADISLTIMSLKTAIDLDSGNADAYHYLADAYILAGRYAEAVAEDCRTLERDPFFAVSRAQLCRIYFWLGDRQNVERQLATLREDNFAPHLIHTTEGALAWWSRDWIAAAKALERALSIDPHNAYTMDHLADCYCRLNRTEEAVAIVEQSHLLSPGKFDTHARLGSLLAHLGRGREVEGHFCLAHELLGRESAAWLNPRSAIYYFNLAWLLSLEGKVDESVKAIETAAELGYHHYADLSFRPDWDSIRSDQRFASLISRLAAQGADVDA